jgi:uncharacterized protein (UPF0248 family)
MENIATPILIQKESIINLKFPAEKIERTQEEEKQLLDKLHRATTLGNIDQQKARIYFKDNEGLKFVETTIWATGEKNIVLKQGITIPIHRIVDVSFY